MPTPLPAAGTENLNPPEADEVAFIARGIGSGCIDGDQLSDLQRTVLEALTESMTGVAVDMAALEPVTAADFAAGLANRNEFFRTRLVQVMELGRMILPEASAEVAQRVIDFATELSLSDELLAAMREHVDRSRQLVANARFH